MVPFSVWIGVEVGVSATFVASSSQKAGLRSRLSRQ